MTDPHPTDIGPSAAPARSAAPSAARSAAPAPAPVPAPAASPAGADRLVVVDDRADVAEALAATLALDGFDVRTATDGLRALETVAEHAPLCVLSDIDMPGIDGLELARRLRAQYGSSMVLIAITGWGEPDERATARFADFDHCMRKPIDIERLRRILRPRV